jgi:biofilm PGA synthesis N-glycosyltransferase PgaC
VAEVLFWACLLLVLQTYVFYPLIVGLLRRRPGEQTQEGGGTEPGVSVVIAVYNEDTVIGERIDNIYSGSYPREKLEVLVGSDGSTDRTNQILSSRDTKGFRAYLYPRRRGKAAVLNDLLKEATGEVIVFSDANTEFSPDTIRELVKPFSDGSVGAVTGELVLRSGNRSVGGEGEVSYWRFENWLKHAESDAGSTLGASGGVYAIRKNFWQPLPYEKSIVDDFLIPMNVLKSGHSVKYRRTARAFEKAADSVGGEFRRKVRIGASNFNGLSELLPLLHPRFGFVAFALWSHKILRWFVPFLLIGLAAASVALRGAAPFYRVFTGLELAFIALALFGLAADRFRWRVGVAGYPYYFLAMNAALFLGFFRAVAGRQTPEWDVVR